MIDHIGLSVVDVQKSKQFYLKVLAPLGYSLFMEFNGEHDCWIGLGIQGKPDFWINPTKDGKPISPRVHVAFRASDKTQVDKFYEAAIEAGAKCNGKPGPRPHYHPGYYGAFVIDPDGHNIEAVTHNYKE